MAKAALAVVSHFAPARDQRWHDERARAFGARRARPADAAGDLPPADASRTRGLARRHDRRNDRLSAQHAVDAPRHSGARGPRTRRPRRPLDRLPRRRRWNARADRLTGHDCCEGHPGNCAVCGRAGSRLLRPASKRRRRGKRPCASQLDRSFNVLFLCTGNSARSIMAEAIMNRVGGENFTRYSAGSQPKGDRPSSRARAAAEAELRHQRLALEELERIRQPGAPQLDFVFTVCDNAAAEACPVWPGQPMTAHWGMPDPAAVTGTRCRDRVRVRRRLSDAQRAHLDLRQSSVALARPALAAKAAG